MTTLKLLLFLALATAGFAQDTAPPVSLGGPAGITGGLPLQGFNTLTHMTDANYTMISAGWWAGTQIVPSTLTLTAIRTITLPSIAGQPYFFCNFSTGGFGVLVGASGGGTLPIANGSCISIRSTSTTNYISAGGSGGTGTVTTVGIGAGWPTWLTPTVNTPTSTPSIAMTFTAIPYTALATSPFYYAGAWSSSTTYPINAVVTSGGNSYYALIASTNASPSSSPTQWQPFITTAVGTVMSVATGTWPSWLTPTVSNPTTTPSLAVAASAIPNTALANSGTTVNGQSCVLGATCTISASAGFNALTGGTNTAAAMVIGTGASLSASGSGTIAATTAAALASTPTACPGGQFATGIAANGNAACSTPAGAGTVNSASQYSPAYYGATGTAVSGITPCTGLELLSTTASPACATPAQIVTQLGSSASIAINSFTCTLGSSCTITAAPPTDIKFYPAAVCDGGTSFAASFTRYDNQQPQTGCDLPASSTAAYLAYNAAPTVAQYAAIQLATPTYWTGSSAYLQFATTATTGTVIWSVQTACVNAGSVLSTASFGTAQTVTTTASATAGALSTTTVLTNIGVPGTNGCTAGTTTPGSILIIRVARSLTDTAAANANFYGMTLVTSRSQ